MTALITGASRGIGKAAAELFASRGYRVFAGYFNTNIRTAHGIIPVRGDLSAPDGVDAMFAQVAEGIDVLVNNAGIALVKQVQDTTLEDWKRIIDTNLTSAFLCTQKALPYMLGRKSGAIVNVSSIWGVRGASCESAYAASKAGLIGFTKSLAAELGASGIRVNAIAPGAVDTDMNKDFSRAELEELSVTGKILTPETVAEAILFFAENGITGAVAEYN